MRESVSQSTVLTSGAFELLEAAGVGFLVLDEDGGVQFISSAARTIIAATKSVWIRMGLLHLEEPAALSLSSALHEGGCRVIHVRTRTEDDGAQERHALTLVLRRLVGTLAPEVAQQRPPGLRATGVFLVTMIPTATQPEGLEQVLREQYAMTRTEARIARRLYDGCSLAEAADQLDVELSTARTHLKRIFSKTGTHRQTQLVREIAARAMVMAAVPYGGAGATERSSR